MSVYKSVYTRSIKVIPSANCDIPNPALFTIADATTSTSTDELVCTNVDFIQSNVQVGDIVYNYVDSLAATVIKIIDANTLLLNADIFISTAIDFEIYAGTQNSASSAGCVLYNPDSGTPVNLTDVVTIGGDIISTISIPVGAIPLPIQVRKVSTASATLIALW